MQPKKKYRAKAPQRVAQQRKKKNATYLPAFFFVLAVTLFCLSPILQNDFTNWDDQYYVVNNALLRGPDWKGIFTQPIVSNYHPITIVTLAINYALSGTQAWSYLLLNLLLHTANTALVFVFIYRISGKKTIVAFLTALVFGIHPLHVESVAWISERKDVLYTLFFVLSLMQYWRFLVSGKLAGLWLCFLFFILSVLSKPAAIILPLILLLLDYWKGRQVSKRIIIEKIPFFLVAVLFTVITLKLQSVTAMTSLDMYPLWVRLFFASYVVTIYVLRFFVPYPLSAFHPFPPPGNLGWEIYLSPIFLAALLYFIWQFRKNKLIVFGLMFFLVNILLVLQLISIGFTIVSERYTYVPYIGLAFLTAMLLEKYFKEKRTLAWGLAILVFGFFGILSFNRTKVWQDSDTLWSDVIRRYPKPSLPRADRAQFFYNKAIAMPPQEAAPLYRRVIDDCTVVINNDTDSSKDSGKKSGTSMYYMRGIAYNSLGQYEKAFIDFNNCLSVDPNYTEALYYRGTLLVNQYNKNADALKDFTKAIQLNAQGKYYLNRSICYYKLGDLAHAKEDGQMALQKGVSIPDSYRKMLNL